MSKHVDSVQTRKSTLMIVRHEGYFPSPELNCDAQDVQHVSNEAECLSEQRSLFPYHSNYRASDNYPAIDPTIRHITFAVHLNEVPRDGTIVLTPRFFEDDAQ
jgi:hypothetical protein